MDNRCYEVDPNLNITSGFYYQDGKVTEVSLPTFIKIGPAQKLAKEILKRARSDFYGQVTCVEEVPAFPGDLLVGHRLVVYIDDAQLTIHLPMATDTLARPEKDDSILVVFNAPGKGAHTVTCFRAHQFQSQFVIGDECLCLNEK